MLTSVRPSVSKTTDTIFLCLSPAAIVLLLMFLSQPLRAENSSVTVAAGVSGLSAQTWEPADAATEAQVNEWTNNLSFGFTPNRGQVANIDGKTADDVLFSANVQGAEVYVTKSGLSHYFLKRIKKGAKVWRPKGAAIGPKEFEWRRIDLNLTGAAIAAERVTMEEPLTDLGVTHFYRSQRPEGVLGVPTYGKVTFAEVYRGIDWVVLSRPGAAVQHDFIVRPGADIAQIRMEYRGASSIEISADAARLRIRTELGEVQEGALHCFQADGAPVNGRFVVDGNIVTFAIDDYDRSQTLTIDPPLVWSTYYGGSNFDGPRSILCDNVNDFVYVVGYSFSNNMPTQNAPNGAFFQGTLTDSLLIDGFIWKFTQAGVRLWATYYGGTGSEANADCALDQFQNLYVCGYTTATNWPRYIMPGAYNDTTYNGGQADATIMKFNSLGVRQWASYYGGENYDYATSLVIDATGNIFMTGYTSSTMFPLLNPGGGAYFQPTIATFEDAFVVKFSPLGAQLWSTYLGGAGNEEALGIVVTVNAIYVTGLTQSPAFPVLNAAGAYFDSTLGGTQDGFVSRFNLNGVQTWASYLGGDSTDWADDAVVDGSGNVFVAGYSESTNFPVVNPGGAYIQSWGGDLDMTITKFTGADSLIWSTYYGGSQIDFLMGASGKSICLDPQGRFYITGMTFSTNFPVLNPPGPSFFQGTNIGVQDATIGVFNNSGTMLWSTYWGSDNPDFGSSISIGNYGCIFATGEAVDSGTFFLANPGGSTYYQPICGGLDDGYIAKFCQPTGACCIDFNCIPANSQAECTALGGQTFYPNQSCSTTTCSILCNICGTKYNDLNKNGVQDLGEPGLAGWTIQLYYWNGPLYASTTTDGSGNYCFNNIPCGAWTVTEQLQPNWVQTFPSPSVHNYSMGTGQTISDADFGNASCIADTCCIKPAAGMIAWYPFDETATGPANDIAARTRSGWHYADQFAHAEGVVNGAIALDSARYVRVFDDPFAQVDTGDFSIDVWINPETFAAACPNSPYQPCAAIPILDNRNSASGGNGNNGIMLYLKRVSSTQARLGLAMNVFPNAVDTFETPTAPVVLNEWQHVAVTVDRSSGSPVGVFYYNGDSVCAFTPRAGRIYSTNGVGSVLDIGHGPTSVSSNPGESCLNTERHFVGLLDELEIWIRPLPATEIDRLYSAGSRGKCKITCTLPTSAVLCRTATTVTLNLTICNRTPNTSVAQFSFAPMATGSGCNFDASGITFSPANGTINLAPGQCTQIPVTLSRPLGFTAGNVACFCVTVRDTLSGAMSTCCSKLIASNTWCVTVKDPRDITGVAMGQARTFVFSARNESDSAATLDYTLRGESSAEGGALTALRLNGLPPGVPVAGSLNLPPWGETNIDGAAVLGAFNPLDLESILIEADVDGDGVADALDVVLVQPVSFPDCNGNGIADSLDLLNGTAVDANGNGFPDECEPPSTGATPCYVCGDADGSAAVSISDAVYLINYIFAGGPAPSPVLAGDADCTASVSISDAVYLINYIFGGGPQPCSACP
ncbi:MAG: SBBP repeat-containing protein [candidate division Zixibacteria bacterium]|nr:SBBP repeat-containing protein [candidate division Zixibacteria bacterium]